MILGACEDDPRTIGHYVDEFENDQQSFSLCYDPTEPFWSGRLGPC